MVILVRSNQVETLAVIYGRSLSTLTLQPTCHPVSHSFPLRAISRAPESRSFMSKYQPTKRYLMYLYQTTKILIALKMKHCKIIVLDLHKINVVVYHIVSDHLQQPTCPHSITAHQHQSLIFENPPISRKINRKV